MIRSEARDFWNSMRETVAIGDVVYFGDGDDAIGSAVVEWSLPFALGGGLVGSSERRDEGTYQPLF